MKSILRGVLLLAACWVGVGGHAQINVNTATAYTENFDGMAATLSLPANWRMAASTSSPTWASAAMTVSQQSSTGSPTAGGTYNWGQTASERAAGAMTSNSFASPNSLIGWYRNTNSWPVSQLAISYKVERYRVNTAAASIQFYYSLDGTNWTAATAGDVAESSLPTGANAYSFATPTPILNVGSFNINSLNIPAGSSFYLRWNINTTGSNSQGIGIDDISVTPTFSVSPTNITPGGVNWVGANQGYAQPVNCNGASPFAMKYRRVATTTNQPTDGRGQWFTTLNAQLTGGDVTLQNMAGGASNGFLFTNGNNCGATGAYDRKWVFGGVGQAALNAVNNNQFLTTGGSDMGLNMSTAGYYSFSLRDAGNVNSAFYVGYTAAAPVTISHGSVTLNNDYSLTVSASLSANPSAQERFFIRYRVGTNDFTTGTAIVEGTGTGTSRTFAIPAQAVGAVVYYYLFSSTMSQAALSALSEGDRSLACINYTDNNNSNFSFTIPAPTTYTWNAAGTGSWTTASNWSPNGVPANGDNVVFSNATAVTVTNVPNISLRSLVFSAAGQVDWQSAQNIIVGVGFAGASNPAMTLASGKTLRFNSTTNSIRINIRNGFTARIDGRMEFSGSPHRFTAEAANAISFEIGAYFLAGTGFTGNAFGSTSTSIGTDGSIIFKVGSTYEWTAGANPFGDAGDTRAAFNSGSLYIHNSNSFPSFSGRTYANVRVTSAAAANLSNLTGNGAYFIDNLELENNVTLGLNLTTTGSIRGNIIIGSGSTLSFAPAPGFASTVQINGSAAQSLSGAGNLVVGANATMSVLSGSTFNLGTNVISGVGTFTIQPGGTLGIGSPDGITTFPAATGNIRTTTRSFSTSGNYVYNGAANQVTGNALPTTVNILGINNSGTISNNFVTLTNNNTQATTFNLQAGIFRAGSTNALRIAAGGTVNGMGGHVSTNSNGEGGTIEFLANGTVTGTPNLYNITIGNSGGGVDFTNNATIYNEFRINNQGSVNPNAPRYASGSTLIYNTTGNYSRSLEWSNFSGSPGYPHHVKVINGTNLWLNDRAILQDSLVCGGNLEIGDSISSGSVYMRGSLGQMIKYLGVRGHLTLGHPNRNDGGRLELSESVGGDLWLYGDFSRYSESIYDDKPLFANGRAIFFKGSNNASINVLPTTPAATISNPTQQDFSYMFVDKSNSNATITLNCDVGITQQIGFISGIINSYNPVGLLVIKRKDPSGVIEDNTAPYSYVNGPIRRYLGTTPGIYVMPVGKLASDRYKPAKVSTLANINTKDFFDAEYFYSSNITPQAGPNEVFAGNLIGILKDEYWQIDRGNTGGGIGETHAKVTLPYANPGSGFWRMANGATLDPCWNCNVAVVKRTTNSGNSIWEFTNAISGNFTSTGNPPEYRFYENNGDIISKTISSFSPFTIGFSYNTILALPVKLLGFEGRINHGDGLLQWSIADDKDLKHFELEYSSDGSRFTKLATIPAPGQQYEYLHRQLPAGKHFYRLKVYEKQGNTWFSKVVMLESGNGITFITGLQSTLVQQQAVALIKSASAQKAEAMLTDVQGRLIGKYTTQLLPGNNQWQLSLPVLSSSVYYLTIHTADGVRKSLRFMHK